MTYVSLFPIAFILFILYLRKKRIKQHIEANIRRKNGDTNMQELVRRFIGKDVIINLISSSVDGIVKEVTENGLVIENNGKITVVNIDYIVKIKEYPLNAKGKRKIIADELI